MVDYSVGTHPIHKRREVSRARWRCAASHTKSLLDEIQRFLRPYVCSREDCEVVFHSLFYALLTPSYSWLFSGKRHCLFTDARFPYTISAPLFDGVDRHSLNSRTQKVQEWQGILQSTVHPYVWVGSALGNKHLRDSWKNIWKPCTLLGCFSSGSPSKFAHLPTVTQQNTSKPRGQGDLVLGHAQLCTNA